MLIFLKMAQLFFLIFFSMARPMILDRTYLLNFIMSVPATIISKYGHHLLKLSALKSIPATLDFGSGA